MHRMSECLDNGRAKLAEEVRTVRLVHSVYLVSFVQPNKPNNDLLTLVATC